jgi:hypothetical protein
VKAKLGRKNVRAWKWMPFTNPARTDGAVFYHWRRSAEEGKEYPFAKFNKVCTSHYIVMIVQNYWNHCVLLNAHCYYLKNSYHLKNSYQSLDFLKYSYSFCQAYACTALNFSLFDNC